MSSGAYKGAEDMDEREIVELTLPIKPKLLSLVRFAAATLAANADFSLEEIEDLRLAADEMCLSLTGGTADSLMQLALCREGDEIEIRCSVERAVVKDRDEDSEIEWSLQILDALVDAHGRDLVSGRCVAWLRKRRARASH